MKLRDLLDYIKDEIHTQMTSANNDDSTVPENNVDLVEDSNTQDPSSKKPPVKGGKLSKAALYARMKAKGRNYTAGKNQKYAATKGTVGTERGRKLSKKLVPKRDAKAGRIFDTIASGGKQAKRALKKAKSMKGAGGGDWPAGVWAIATDQTIKNPESGKSTPPVGNAKAKAKVAQKSAEKKVSTTPTAKKSKKPAFKKIKQGKTSKDKNQLPLFKKK